MAPLGDRGQGGTGTSGFALFGGFGAESRTRSAAWQVFQREPVWLWNGKSGNFGGKKNHGIFVDVVFFV